MKLIRYWNVIAQVLHCHYYNHWLLRTSWWNWSLLPHINLQSGCSRLSTSKYCIMLICNYNVMIVMLTAPSKPKIEYICEKESSIRNFLLIVVLLTRKSNKNKNLHWKLHSDDKQHYYQSSFSITSLDTTSSMFDGMELVSRTAGISFFERLMLMITMPFLWIS
jgi:hypothetical protein